jgi:hypothetical protein
MLEPFFFKQPLSEIIVAVFLLNKHFIIRWFGLRFMVFNATFNNILVVSFIDGGNNRYCRYLFYFVITHKKAILTNKEKQGQNNIIFF